ncbi:acyl-coenzyme A thioesterase 9, mitochondrial-like isoform X2 [Apostichopus japonicus]|uniref:acyl-coenzyme A thioesterase 9, mitochondrial-like isoform X2 n=1 Tax=Stichopus japonicus TaxID=307972 RepID=UPI003AB85147
MLPAMTTSCSRLMWKVLRANDIKFCIPLYRRCLSTTPPPSRPGRKRIPWFHELIDVFTIYTKQDEQMSSLPPAPKSTDGLVPRTMADSYVECMIDLQDPAQAMKYSNALGGLRIGRILEDLDMVGAASCYKHSVPDQTLMRSPLVIVTSMTEKLEMSTATIDTATCNLKFSSHVAWTGRSTLEVPLTVSLIDVKDNRKETPIMTSVFIYNARDHKDGSAACVHPLISTNDEEEKRIKEGAEKHQQRKLISSDFYWKSPPSVEERNVIHDVFLESLDPQSLSLTERILPPDSEWMECTKKTIALPAPPDVSNVYGTVFGGYIMRTAAELAFTTGAMFSKGPVTFLHVSDIQFKAPSKIASILIFTGEIAYTEGNRMHVRVQTDVTDMITKYTSNTSHWIVSSPQKLPRVIPKTYGEFMLYLDARRRFKEVK